MLRKLFWKLRINECIEDININIEQKNLVFVKIFRTYELNTSSNLISTKHFINLSSLKNFFLKIMVIDTLFSSFKLCYEMKILCKTNGNISTLGKRVLFIFK